MSPLATARCGLRFVDRATETDYWLWVVRGALPLLRAVAGICALIGIVWLPINRASFPASWPRIAVVTLIGVVVNASAIFYSYRVSLRWIRPAVVGLSLLNGGFNVAFTYWVLARPNLPGDTASPVVVHVFLVAMLLRLGPALTILATIPVAAFAQVLNIQQFVAGKCDAHFVAIVSSATGIIFILGIVISAAMDRSFRRSYRQERTIDMQR